jgi:S1-C subfamily serine protease
MKWLANNWIKIISVLVVVVVVSSVAFIGFDKYLSYSQAKEQEKADLIARQRATEDLANRQSEELIAKEQQTAELLAKQQELIEKISNDAKDQSSSEIESLNKKIAGLETKSTIQSQTQKQSDEQIAKLKEDIVASTETTDSSDYNYDEQSFAVMSTVAKVLCYLRNGDISTGSGSLWEANGKNYLLTNIHVLEDADRDDEYCVIIVPIDWNEVVDDPDIAYKNDNLLIYPLSQSYNYWEQSGLDMAIVEILEGDQSLSLLDDWGVMSTNEAECKETVPVGDKVVIVGFPYTGASYIPTVTEGLISSFENVGDTRYYITSAKIEHGNSGGIAVTEDYYCMVGIPTSVSVGETESLGKILLLTEEMLKEYFDSLR